MHGMGQRGSVWQFDRPFDEPCVVGGWRSGAWSCPDIRAQVVVVASCAKEQSTRINPRNAIEPERLGVEGCSLLQIADVQVHMSDHGAGRHTRPALTICRTDNATHVDRVGRNHQLLTEAAPGRARSIRIHLDSETVRIMQVKSLADEMIGCADWSTGERDVVCKPTERRAIR